MAKASSSKVKILDLEKIQSDMPLFDDILSDLLENLEPSDITDKLQGKHFLEEDDRIIIDTEPNRTQRVVELVHSLSEQNGAFESMMEILISNFQSKYEKLIQQCRITLSKVQPSISLDNFIDEIKSFYKTSESYILSDDSELPVNAGKIAETIRRASKDLTAPILISGKNQKNFIRQFCYEWAAAESLPYKIVLHAALDECNESETVAQCALSSWKVQEANKPEYTLKSPYLEEQISMLSPSETLILFDNLNQYRMNCRDLNEILFAEYTSIPCAIVLASDSPITLQLKNKVILFEEERPGQLQKHGSSTMDEPRMLQVFETDEGETSKRKQISQIMTTEADIEDVMQELSLSRLGVGRLDVRKSLGTMEQWSMPPPEVCLHKSIGGMFERKTDEQLEFLDKIQQEDGKDVQPLVTANHLLLLESISAADFEIIRNEETIEEQWDALMTVVKAKVALLTFSAALTEAGCDEIATKIDEFSAATQFLTDRVKWDQKGVCKLTVTDSDLEPLPWNLELIPSKDPWLLKLRKEICWMYEGTGRTVGKILHIINNNQQIINRLYITFRPGQFEAAEIDINIMKKLSALEQLQVVFQPGNIETNIFDLTTDLLGSLPNLHMFALLDQSESPVPLLETVWAHLPSSIDWIKIHRIQLSQKGKDILLDTISKLPMLSHLSIICGELSWQPILSLLCTIRTLEKPKLNRFSFSNQTDDPKGLVFEKFMNEITLWKSLRILALFGCRLSETQAEILANTIQQMNHLKEFLLQWVETSDDVIKKLTDTCSKCHVHFEIL